MIALTQLPTSATAWIRRFNNFDGFEYQWPSAPATPLFMRWFYRDSTSVTDYSKGLWWEYLVKSPVSWGQLHDSSWCSLGRAAWLMIFVRDYAGLRFLHEFISSSGSSRMDVYTILHSLSRRFCTPYLVGYFARELNQGAFHVPWLSVAFAISIHSSCLVQSACWSLWSWAGSFRKKLFNFAINELIDLMLFHRSNHTNVIVRILELRLISFIWMLATVQFYNNSWTSGVFRETTGPRGAIRPWPLFGKKVFFTIEKIEKHGFPLCVSTSGQWKFASLWNPKYTPLSWTIIHLYHSN